MNKELRELIGTLVEQGYTVRRTSKNHYLVTKNGQRVTTLAGTASDHRSMKNARADIRRHERREQG